MDNTIIETEYHFSIPRASLKIFPPKKLASFRLIESSSAIIVDHLIESKRIKLKSENAGMRIRKCQNKISLTYKKLLAKETGSAVFDEINIPLNQEKYKKMISNNFSHLYLPEKILETANRKKQDLYHLFSIINKRNIFCYNNGNDTIELITEDIQYRINSNTAFDSMAEVEIIKGGSKLVDVFLRQFKKLYQCRQVDEGKIDRGMRLLDI